MLQYFFTLFPVIPPFATAYLGHGVSNLIRDAIATLFPTTSHLQLFWGDTKAFPCKAKEIISQGQFQGVFLTCQNHLNWLILMLRSSSSTLSPLLNDWAPHHISKDEPRHLSKEAHFCCLYLRCYSSSHYPQFIAICEVRLERLTVMLRLHLQVSGCCVHCSFFLYRIIFSVS